VIKIPPPDPIPQEPQTQLTSFLLPAGLTIVGLIVMIAVSSSSGGGSSLWISMAVSIPMMLGSYLVSFLNYRAGKRKYAEQKKERIEKYKAMLGRQEAELLKLQEESREALTHNHPPFSKCLELVETLDRRRMWARSPQDDDFLDLRLGRGKVPLEIEIQCPEQNPLHPEPLVDLAHELATKFEAVPDAPITLPIGKASVAGLSGSREEALNAARALTLQIVTHHSPHEVKIVAIYPAQESDYWAWLRWLPHVWSSDRERRYMADDMQGAHKLLELLHEDLKKRKLQLDEQGDYLLQKPLPIWVFFLAAPQFLKGEPILPFLVKDGKELGVYSIFLAQRSAGLPRQCQVMARLEGSAPLIVRDVDGVDETPYEPDTISVAEADQFSRTIAPVRMHRSGQSEAIPDLVTLFDLLQIKRVEELEILQRWQSNNPYDHMSVPMGKIRGGKTQYLDFHEPRNTNEPNARYGHGPNALIAGAVGAGKGEFLYSLIASLTTHFHPYYVNFVLFDFKAPGLVNEVTKSLPHVVSTVTNLDSTSEVARAIKALDFELQRRSALFASLGGVWHIDEYNKQKPDDPLPYLFIIADEFPELLARVPQAKDLFARIARLGRGLGLRLILAAQKPSGVVGPQIDANTMLRLCLRVARPEDSREVIKRTDAAAITKAGRGYLRLGEDVVYELFQSAWSNAPYAPDADVAQEMVGVSRVHLNGERETLDARERSRAGEKKQFKVLVDYVRQEAKSAGIVPSGKVWLPPLPDSFQIEAQKVSGPLWTSGTPWLSPAIGLQDDVVHREQLTLRPDLAQHGHLYLCGGSSEDTRMALRMLIEGLIRDHSPQEVHLYALDFGSSGLAAYQSAPHVGAVIRRDEARRIKRLFRWLEEELQARQQWLVQQGVSSIREYRQSHRNLSDVPALVLIVDGLENLKEDLETRDVLAHLAKNGPPAGIHLVVAGGVTSSSMYKILDNIMTLRIALQLDSEMAYKEILGSYPENLIVPRGIPGRGISKMYDTLLESQVASPLDPAALAGLIETLQEAARPISDGLPEPVPDLPEQISLNRLLDATPTTSTLERWQSYTDSTPLKAPIALDDATLCPIGLDLQRDGPHFLLIGPQGKGKTTALRTWVLSLAETYPGEGVQLILFDSFKQSLMSLRELPHVLHYAATEEEQKQVLQVLRDIFSERRNTDQRQSRPAVVVIIDDFQLFNSDAIKSALLNHAKQDAFLGFHLVVAEASGNTSSYDKLRKQILANASGAFIGSINLIDDAGVFNILLPTEERKQHLREGQGYLVQQGKARLVQFALPGGDRSLHERVARISRIHQRVNT
jgi:S-DNA-T family DNA segregation ATPase FtsK/SpoIIIE